MGRHLLASIAIALVAAIGLPQESEARRLRGSDAITDTVMRRIFRYAQQVDTLGRGSHVGYAYTKFQMRTNKRNATLMLVPTMWAVSHGTGRKFVSEYYSRMQWDGKGSPSVHRLVGLSTIPHRRNTMTAVLGYMTPNVYAETLFQNNILSPFHRSNKRYYQYCVVPLPYGMAQVYAYPRIKNTQLVETRAIVRVRNGQILLCDFEGEYDMTRFYISVTMGKEGFKTLAAAKCEMRANFRFMGNNITGRYSATYDLPKMLSDTLDNVADTALMARVRPVQLSTDEEMMYRDYYEAKGKAEAEEANQPKEHKANFVKDVLWDIVGDNLLNRISSDFGKRQQGYFRIDPLFNPLYMGYSDSKGVVYKFKVRGEYAFDHNWQAEIGMRGGYTFRQHRFYITVPMRLSYNTLHEGYLLMELGNGNRINTNKVARQLLGYTKPKDSIGSFSPTEIPVVKGDDLESEELTEFKDNYLRLTNHWRFSPHWAMELGLVMHDRIAVRPDFYKFLGYPSHYRSVAPSIGLEWRPWAERGPVVKLDYEAGIKHLLGGDIEYRRIELDAQAILYASRRRTYSLRGGMGGYTMRKDNWGFVDYSNFHDNNIPGGWNDDWTGDFELLSSQWYNASDYYLRTNFTYEAPMILSAWLPLVGRFIEKERLYTSALMVEHLHPYTEWGYGVTTRLVSLGIFAAFRNAHFDGVGFKFGFELFRNW